MDEKESIAPDGGITVSFSRNERTKVNVDKTFVDFEGIFTADDEVFTEIYEIIS